MQKTAAPAFHKTADTYAAGAKTLPQRYFVSPEIFAEEQVAIFLKQWVLVGHESQVTKSGDYFVQEIASGFERANGVAVLVPSLSPLCLKFFESHSRLNAR